MSSFEFHFRNFTDRDIYFGVYHAGCGGAPWHEGRPKCWDQTTRNNPGGGQDSVYVPSNWVVNQDAWSQVVADSFVEAADIGVFVASGGTDLVAFESAVADAFTIGVDTIKAAVPQTALEGAVEKISQNRAQAAAAAGLSQAEVQSIADQMGIGQSFTFIAGSTYKTNIHDDNLPTNDDDGWSVLVADPGDGSVNWTCNHAFINSGHLVIAYGAGGSSAMLWKPF